MPHNSRPPAKAHAAAARYARLVDADVPRTLSPAEAWHLSGGVIGRTDGNEPDRPGIPLARIARDVPDCEAFLDDFRAMWATA